MSETPRERAERFFAEVGEDHGTIEEAFAASREDEIRSMNRKWGIDIHATDMPPKRTRRTVTLGLVERAHRVACAGCGYERDYGDVGDAIEDYRNHACESS